MKELKLLLEYENHTGHVFRNIQAKEEKSYIFYTNMPFSEKTEYLEKMIKDMQRAFNWMRKYNGSYFSSLDIQILDMEGDKTIYRLLVDDECPKKHKIRVLAFRTNTGYATDDFQFTWKQIRKAVMELLDDTEETTA